MKINLSLWDRAIRYVLGFFLILWLAAGGPLWSLIGVYFLLSASWGLCPVYLLLGFKTYRENKKP